MWNGRESANYESISSGNEILNFHQQQQCEKWKKNSPLQRDDERVMNS